MVPSSSAGRRKRRLIWVALAVALLATAAASVSLSLRGGVGRVALTQRLTATFGRPVEVGSYDLSLLGGPQLQANFVTVEEDPRFGHEYFLRAEKITADLRWTALLTGRFEFDTLTLTRPSLNLVRLPEGQWNLESWLPVPASVREASSTPALPAPRLRRVEVENGRVNFKRGLDKHPFALTAVTGSFEQQPSGEWRMEAEARPMRAGVVVQEPGTIRVAGRIGGTSARLRPAALTLRWDEVSLSDALRLARGFDYGVRGQLNVEAQVGAAPPSAELSGPAGYRWDFQGVLRLRGVHRWDFPPRATDPSVNVSVQAGWWPALARVEVNQATVEGPATQIRGSGFVQWGRAPVGLAPGQPEVSPQPDARLRFTSSGISLPDLFAWYRAFRSGVADGVALEGSAGLDLQLAGWPIEVQRLTMAIPGARLRVPNLPDAPGFGQGVLRYEASNRTARLMPVNLRFGPAGAPPAGTLRLEAVATPRADWPAEFGVTGATSRPQEALALAAALGMEPVGSWLRRGWSVAGSADLRLRWSGALLPFALRPSGTVRLRNLAVQHALLSEPLRLTGATLDLLAMGPRISVQEAYAFGATWSGRLERREQWSFKLDAGGLNVSDISAGLSPAAPPTLLQRLAPGSTPEASFAEALAGLRASGQLSLRHLTLPPLAFDHFRGAVTLDVAPSDAPPGWRLDLTAAEAQFHGGSLRGSFRAAGGDPTRQPEHRGEFRFRGVNLAALTAVAPRLRGLFAGTATGELSLSAAGATRNALLDSLRSEGRIEIRSTVWNGLDLRESLHAGAARPGRSNFPSAAAAFSLAERGLRIRDLRLASVGRGQDELLGEGSVDTSAEGLDLDLRITTGPAVPLRPAGGAAAGPETAAPGIRLTGPLRSPQVVPVTPITP